MRHALFLLALLTVSVLHAQQNGNGQRPREEFSPQSFDRHMEQFITDHAGLTHDEAVAFFPLLHEMLAKQRENNDRARQALEQCKDCHAGEAQYEQAITAAIDLEEENKRVERTYYRKFSTVLSWEKIYKVRTALVDFQMEALRRFSPPGQQQPGDFRHWNWGGGTETTPAPRR